MAKRLADVLGIPVDRVSVKAKSPEGLGLVGRHEGIAAMAVVSVETGMIAASSAGFAGAILGEDRKGGEAPLRGRS